MSSPRIAVVVPVFNERAALSPLLDELAALRGRHAQWQWRVIVVDDCSSDGSATLLDERERAGEITVVHCPVRVGIGGAVQAGFKVAAAWSADVTTQLDGDGQHPVQAIPALVAKVLALEADVVVGSRYRAGGGGAVSNRLRRFGTFYFSWVLRGLVGARIKDVTSGFRAFNRAAADHLAESYADDYPEVEVLVPLTRLRLRIAELPVEMKPRVAGRSSISALGSLYYMIKVTLALLVHLIKPLPRRPGRSREP